MKINKRIVSLGMIFTFTLTPISQGVLASGIDYSDEVRPYVWAGRPGGNGDGSEEYLNLGYGEMNGPYKAVATNTGKVSDYNKSSAFVQGMLSGLIMPELSQRLASIFLDLASQVIFDSSIEGITYKSTIYVSGRRAKAVIQTYRDDGMTQPYKYYEEIKKW